MLMETAVGDVMKESHMDFHLLTDVDCENSGFHLL
jgi:hypothetical protein